MKEFAEININSAQKERDINKANDTKEFAEININSNSKRAFNNLEKLDSLNNDLEQ
jgi:hypothetical protein